MKSSSALLVTTLLVFPLSAIAQEQPEEDPVEVVQGELLGLLKAKGFEDAKVQQIQANDDTIVIDGLSGSANDRAFKFGRIEIKGIDAGYRWTRASQVAFSNVDVTFGPDSFHAEALLTNGFGILDVDSAQPGFAFDELAVVNGQWKHAGAPLVGVSSLVAKGRQWKELYSIPATLDVKASMTFSGQALLVLLGQMSLPMGVEPQQKAGGPYFADVTARLSSTTSSGLASASLAVKTDKLGSHKVETTLGGFDDGLLESYFARGDENVTGDQEKLKFLKAELNRQIADITVRTLFYQGQSLSGLAPIFSGQSAMISAITNAWVTQNSSEKEAVRNQKLIAEPLSQFLASPSVLEVDVIPERGATLSTLSGAMTSTDGAGRKLLDILGVRVIVR